MKNKILFIALLLFISFCLVVFFKSLNNSNVYIPDTPNKTVKEFKSKSLFSEDEISSEKILVNSDYYILNIWSSWCGPCRREHPKLMADAALLLATEPLDKMTGRVTYSQQILAEYGLIDDAKGTGLSGGRVGSGYSQI